MLEQTLGKRRCIRHTVFSYLVHLIGCQGEHACFTHIDDDYSQKNRGKRSKSGFESEQGSVTNLAKSKSCNTVFYFSLEVQKYYEWKQWTKTKVNFKVISLCFGQRSTRVNITEVAACAPASMYIMHHSLCLHRTRVYPLNIQYYLPK